MNAPREPSADMRVAARELHQLYVALSEQFTQQEALVIVGMVLGNNLNPQQQK